MLPLLALASDSCPLAPVAAAPSSLVTQMLDASGAMVNASEISVVLSSRPCTLIWSPASKFAKRHHVDASTEPTCLPSVVSGADCHRIGEGRCVSIHSDPDLDVSPRCAVIFESKVETNLVGTIGGNVDAAPICGWGGGSEAPLVDVDHANDGEEIAPADVAECLSNRGQVGPERNQAAGASGRPVYAVCSVMPSAPCRTGGSGRTISRRPRLSGPA